MKVETILGEQVVRVDALGNGCTVANDRAFTCVFIARNCQLPDGMDGMACGFSSDLFIRPDQIVDYLAIKLVS